MREFLFNTTRYLKELNTATVAVRILLAVIFGGIIGIERDRHGSQAGMRTHILVCLGGALTSLLGIYCNTVLCYDSDPIRISAQVVSGIGFLGAGMIIVKSNTVITGLTTAAIMWATAIIGIGLGMGFYNGAFFALLACIFTAAVLTRIERKRRKITHIYIEVDDLQMLELIVEEVKKLVPPDAYIEVISPKSGIVGHMGICVLTSHIVKSEEVKHVIKSFSGIHFIAFG